MLNEPERKKLNELTSIQLLSVSKDCIEILRERKSEEIKPQEWIHLDKQKRCVAYDCRKFTKTLVPINGKPCCPYCGCNRMEEETK